MINQVAIVGELVSDIDLRYTREGAAVTSITLAVARCGEVHNGRNKTDYIRCVLWNKTAEKANQRCKKGTVVGVVGILSSRTYFNEKKKRVYMTEVLVDRVRVFNRPLEKEFCREVGFEEFNGNMNISDLNVMESTPGYGPCEQYEFEFGFDNESIEV